MLTSNKEVLEAFNATFKTPEPKMVSDLSCIVIISGLPTPEASKGSGSSNMFTSTLSRSLATWQKLSIFRFHWTQTTPVAVSVLSGLLIPAAPRSVSESLMATPVSLEMIIRSLCASIATWKSYASYPRATLRNRTRPSIVVSATDASTSLSLAA